PSPAPAIEPVIPHPPAAPVQRSFPLKWVPAIGLAAAAGFSILLLRPAEKPVAARGAPPPVVAAPPKPSSLPRQDEAHRQFGGPWRVIAWTYTSRAAAEQKVRSLNQKFPQFHAEVFAPKGSGSPYFVSLGGRMAKADALAVQRQARAHGLPRDT